MLRCRFRSVATGRFASLHGMTDINGASVFDIDFATGQLQHEVLPVTYESGSLRTDVGAVVRFTGKATAVVGCLQVGSHVLRVDDDELALAAFDKYETSQHWERVDVVSIAESENEFAFKCAAQSLECTHGRPGYDEWSIRLPILARQLARTGAQVLLLTHASREMCLQLVKHAAMQDMMEVVCGEQNVAIIYSTTAFKYETAKRWSGGPCVFAKLRHASGRRVGFVCMATGSDHDARSLLSSIQTQIPSDAYILGGCFDAVGVSALGRQGWRNLSGLAPTMYDGKARDFVLGKGMSALETHREAITEPMPNTRQGSSHIPVACRLAFSDGQLQRFMPTTPMAGMRRLVLRDAEDKIVTFEEVASAGLVVSLCALQHPVLFCERANFGVASPTLLVSRKDYETLQKHCGVAFGPESSISLEPIWLKRSSFSPAGIEWRALWVMPDALHRVLQLPSNVPSARGVLRVTIPFSGWNSRTPVRVAIIRALAPDGAFAHFVEADRSGARLACLCEDDAMNLARFKHALSNQQLELGFVTMSASVLVFTQMSGEALTPELFAKLLQNGSLAQIIATTGLRDWARTYITLFAPES